MDIKITPIISTLVFILIFVSFVSSYQPANDANSMGFESRAELKNLKYIRDYLKKVNKPAVKTIKSPDGDLIDCVPSHQQPAFDHPLLKGQKPMNPPEMPKWVTSLLNDTYEETFQVWTKSGEACPENTVPIRRTTEEEVVRASSVQTFGRKPRLASTVERHEHAVAYTGRRGAFYGAAAIIELWAPKVETSTEFSLAQIWLVGGTDTNGKTISSIEAGWHIYPHLYKGTGGVPRLFVYWTGDAYEQTGCYNLLCSGFVHTSKKLALGAAYPIVSSYDAQLYGLPFYVHKDGSKGGSRDWWLFVGQEAVGYWPQVLFPFLGDGPVDTIEFGGEVTNTMSKGTHTTTQMGSGHFSREGYNKAASFRRMKVFDIEDNFTPADPKKIKWKTFTEKGVDRCYSVSDVKFDSYLGDYFYYGGPGRGRDAPKCK